MDATPRTSTDQFPSHPTLAKKISIHFSLSTKVARVMMLWQNDNSKMDEDKKNTWMTK